MNRQQRRAAQSQAGVRTTITVLGKSLSPEEANALALKEYGAGNLQHALEIFQSVAAHLPRDPEAHYRHGILLHTLGRLSEALPCYAKVVALQPQHADAQNNRAVILQGMKRYEDALAGYNKALAARPDFAEAHNNRGDTLSMLQRYEEALASFDRAIALKPQNAATYNSRGVTFDRIGRFEEALQDYDKAIALSPGYFQAYINRAAALQEIKRYDSALETLTNLLALKPDDIIAYNNRGDILRKLKRYDEALADFSMALKLEPDFAEAYNNRGVALQEMGRQDEALADFNRAATARPDYDAAFNNSGAVLQEKNQYEAALACFDKALALNPNYPYLLGSACNTRMHLCEWRGIDALFKKVAAGINAGQHICLPFHLLAMPVSAAQQSKCAQIYARDKFPAGAVPVWKGEKYAHDRIRIGYYSSDLRNHALFHLLAEFFELHDRSLFEVTAFCLGPPASNATQARINAAFEHVIDVHKKTGKEIAALTRNMEIDIAVDLNGFTQGSRTEIFALRPAPVQVSYMGFPGTMGTGYIDYLMADSIVVPEEHKRHYAEKIVHLPHSYWVIDSSRKISEKNFTRRQMGLPETGFVFCCFNNTFKITPDVFAVWMRLLQNVEGSVLWLLKGNEAVEKNLRAEAGKHGIADHRLIFAERTNVDDHMIRQRLADLFLDTFYYTAHTTTSDALWEGLPVLTCLGETFTGRVAASLLNAANLPELVTRSHAEYETLAFELATQPHTLSAIREKLARERAGCPLFNTRQFTKYFENAFLQMQRRTIAGLPPEDLSVPGVLL